MASTDLKTKCTWFEAYPPPKNRQSETVTRDGLRQWILEDQSPDKKFIVVDVRREDHEGGTIKRAINLPAQTIYPSLPTTLYRYALIKAAGIKRVIWTCTTSRKRGNLAAGWFADLLSEKGDSEIESFALLEGILGWPTAGEEFTNLMEGYEEAVWKRDHSGH
ncbi:arsenate reductase [Apiosordaria backusii]|uniref:Arsenate reductase n=1 Tax=Apiosordaria backusii TaxID=314023 RepID=A0AA40ELK0_9PEZI|nr:arsenate reductase [Apiosordaria backusii]